MNIWLFQTGEPLPFNDSVRKMRTALVAEALTERGHSILWWTTAFEHQQKRQLVEKDTTVEISQNYSIRLLTGCRYRKNISMTRYLNHQIVAWKFRLQVSHFDKPDLIIASMPDHILAYEAAKYANRNDVKLITDIRDLWPDIFITPFNRVGLGWLVRKFLFYDFCRLKALLRKSDGITAVSKGYLQWGLDKIGRLKRDTDRVFYLGYSCGKSKFEGDAGLNQRIPEWLRALDEKIVLIFIGTFGVSYELELVINAAKHFERLGRTNLCFILAGTGEKFNKIKEMSAGLSIVRLPGWISQEEIALLLKIADVGLVSCKSTENTIPNKPFEYLSAGLPLINSLEGEMADIIKQNEIGLNYLPGDLEHLCECISVLVTNDSVRKKMSRKAKEFFSKYGNAGIIYSDYTNYIEEIFIG